MSRTPSPLRSCSAGDEMVMRSPVAGRNTGSKLGATSRWPSVQAAIAKANNVMRGLIPRRLAARVDDNHSTRAADSVDGCGRNVLEHIDLPNVIIGQTGECGVQVRRVHRDAIDDDERLGLRCKRAD